MSAADFLNLDQSPEELAELYGERDQYHYLRSPPFVTAFLSPLAAIVDRLGLPVLDVACGEAVLGDLVHVPYRGFDGSLTAVRRAHRRNATLVQRVTCERFEDPVSPGLFGTVVFGGVLEVLVKPAARVPLLEMYRARYRPTWFVVYDLWRLDVGPIRERLGSPVEEYRMEIVEGCDEIPEKRRRKIEVYQWRSS